MLYQRLSEKLATLMKRSYKMDYYGEIAYLSSQGIIGEYWYCKTKEEYEKEIHDSNEIGRPIQTIEYEREL